MIGNWKLEFLRVGCMITSWCV